MRISHGLPLTSELDALFARDANPYPLRVACGDGDFGRVPKKVLCPEDRGLFVAPPTGIEPITNP